MSKWRDKARAVKEAGVKERGNFTPTGVPLRIYNYWLNESDSARAGRIRRGETRENFCHFWRVVAIWAPLRALWNLITHPVTLGALFAALVVVLAFTISVTGGWGGLLLGAGLGLAALAALALVIMMALSGLSLTFKNPESLGFPPHRVAWFFVWSPLTWLFFGIGKFVMWRYFPKVAAGAGIALAIAAIALLTWASHGIFLLMIASIALVVAVLYFAATYIQGHRALAEEDNNKDWAYFVEHGYFPEEAPREPGRVSKFFRGIGDLIILLAQVVRVKKWKICPMVEIKP